MSTQLNRTERSLLHYLYICIVYIYTIDYSFQIYMRNALYRMDANETEHTEVIAPHAPREIELLFTVPPADRTLCVAAQNTQIIYMYTGSTK